MQSLRHLNTSLLVVALSLWAVYFATIDGGLKAPPIYDILDPPKETNDDAADRWAGLISDADEEYAAGRYDLAKVILDDALELSKSTFGNDHSNTATSLDRLGLTQVQLGAYEDADTLLTQAVSLREDIRGPDHPDTASSLNNLAGLYGLQNKWSDAEALYRRAIAINETTFGREHPTTATTLGNLASLLSSQARFDEAEALFQEVIENRESQSDPMEAKLGEAKNNLAVLYLRTGDYDAAYPLLVQALEISESANGKTHPMTATTQTNLAGLYMERGNYADAERAYRRALSNQERSLGNTHPIVAQTLLNLGLLFEKQDRLGDAERFALRALRINEASLGEDHPETGRALNNLARLYQAYGMLDAADPLYWRSYNVAAGSYGEAHPQTATALNNWAALALEREEHAKAEQILSEALVLQTESLGDNHPLVADTLNNLASAYRGLGELSKAEQNYKKSIDLNVLARGHDHPSVARSYNNLAYYYFDQGEIEEALAAIRQSSNILANRANLNIASSLSGGARSELTAAGSVFQMHSAIAWKAANATNADAAGLKNEAFIAAQRAEQRKASDALSQMSARIQTVGGDLAELVREREDLVARWRAFDELVTESFLKDPTEGDAILIENLKRDQEATAERLDTIDQRIAVEFPAYLEISRPVALSIREIQDLLSPSEALVFFLVGGQESYVWAVRDGASTWHQLNATRDEIAGKVETLRDKLTGPCCGAFDLSTSHALYLDLMAPIESFLEGSDHLIVVPSGPLQSLPLSVLTTEQPDPNYLALANYGGYRQANWLINSYAITTLPAVSSLKALRATDKMTLPDRPFIGFGNPVLSGSKDLADRSGLTASAFFNGTTVDVTQIRTLSPLTESEAELLEIAETLGAPRSAIYTGGEATESSVKAAPLDQYRVVSFATHGLIAGELDGLAEPALVLTPPDVVTPEDDGLLTASEVATLTLNADWVILSACNTAAGEAPGAEPLSGLARAFFYAGSQSMLVSHWPVNSEAAVQLTTSLFRERAADPAIGKSEALRRAIRSQIEDRSTASNAHPAIWAPFVVIGDGA